MGVLGYEKKRFDDAPTALSTTAEMLVVRAMSRRGSQTVQLDVKSTVSRKTRATSLCVYPGRCLCQNKCRVMGRSPPHGCLKVRLVPPFQASPTHQGLVHSDPVKSRIGTNRELSRYETAAGHQSRTTRCLPGRGLR